LETHPPLEALPRGRRAIIKRFYKSSGKVKGKSNTTDVGNNFSVEQRQKRFEIFLNKFNFCFSKVCKNTFRLRRSLIIRETVAPTGLRRSHIFGNLGARSRLVRTPAARRRV